MLVVETIAKMRRLSPVQGKSIKAICRELGISPEGCVVRKVLRSDETEFRYERILPVPRPMAHYDCGNISRFHLKYGVTTLPKKNLACLINAFGDLRYQLRRPRAPKAAWEEASSNFFEMRLDVSDIRVTDLNLPLEKADTIRRQVERPVWIIWHLPLYYGALNAVVSPPLCNNGARLRDLGRINQFEHKLFC